MENKKGTYLRLSEKTKKRIKQIADESNQSQSDAVATAIDHYFKDKDNEHSILINTLSTLLDEKLSGLDESLKKIRLIGNLNDRDTKIILEFMNHYYIVNDFKRLITTSDYKSEGITAAEDIVKSRIAKNRQRSIDSQNS